MKIALTSIETITGKDGREWARISGFTKSGKSVKAFMPKAKCSVPDSESPELEALTEASAYLPSVNVEFDEDGRVEEASLVS